VVYGVMSLLGYYTLSQSFCRKCRRIHETSGLQIITSKYW